MKSATLLRSRNDIAALVFVSATDSSWRATLLQGSGSAGQWIEVRDRQGRKYPEGHGRACARYEPRAHIISATFIVPSRRPDVTQIPAPGLGPGLYSHAPLGLLSRPAWQSEKMCTSVLRVLLAPVVGKWMWPWSLSRAKGWRPDPNIAPVLAGVGCGCAFANASGPSLVVASIGLPIRNIGDVMSEKGSSWGSPLVGVDTPPT